MGHLPPYEKKISNARQGEMGMLGIEVIEGSMQLEKDAKWNHYSIQQYVSLYSQGSLKELSPFSHLAPFLLNLIV